MPQKHKNSNHHLFILIAVLIVIVFALFLRNNNFQILNPKGIIAFQERDLIVHSLLPMLLVIIAVVIAAFIIARKYRASNKKAKYLPNWDHNLLLQILWWLIPSIIIFFLANLSWKTAHALDPFKPIPSANRPMTIQVVSLNWKWLFIYPEQKIATVNFLEFPEKTPIIFELTSDGPMNSFWIPQLSGQMYAMAGMTTKLNVMADGPGTFAGSAAEINGRGFADMKFVAHSTTKTDFDNWVKSTQEFGSFLDWDNYEQLALPSEDNSKALYSSVDPNLFDKIIEKYSPAFKTHSH